MRTREVRQARETTLASLPVWYAYLRFDTGPSSFRLARRGAIVNVAFALRHVTPFFANEEHRRRAGSTTENDTVSPRSRSALWWRFT